MYLDPESTPDLAEENCVCQEQGYGCVIVLAIQQYNDWSSDAKLYAHEFGHVLGVELHDDHFYD